jgi:hypothetical protein
MSVRGVRGPSGAVTRRFPRSQSYGGIGEGPHPRCVHGLRRPRDMLDSISLSSRRLSCAAQQGPPGAADQIPLSGRRAVAAPGRPSGRGLHGRSLGAPTRAQCLGEDGCVDHVCAACDSIPRRMWSPAGRCDHNRNELESHSQTCFRRYPLGPRAATPPLGHLAPSPGRYALGPLAPRAPGAPLGPRAPAAPSRPTRPGDSLGPRAPGAPLGPRAPGTPLGHSPRSPRGLPRPSRPGGSPRLTRPDDASPWSPRPPSRRPPAGQFLASSCRKGSRRPQATSCPCRVAGTREDAEKGAGGRRQRPARVG